jgi:hypothetical protein
MKKNEKDMTPEEYREMLRMEKLRKAQINLKRMFDHDKKYTPGFAANFNK